MLGSTLRVDWLMLDSTLSVDWLMLGSTLRVDWLMLGSTLRVDWLMLGSTLSVVTEKRASDKTNECQFIFLSQFSFFSLSVYRHFLCVSWSVSPVWRQNWWRSSPNKCQAFQLRGPELICGKIFRDDLSIGTPVFWSSSSSILATNIFRQTSHWERQTDRQKRQR